MIPLPIADQTFQLIAWFLALAEFIVALYVLVLNAWYTANRHLSALLFLVALNNLAVGLMAGATNASQAIWPSYILAATSATIQPATLLVTVALLKPDWLRGRRRWGWWPVYGLVFLPILLTLVDTGLGTRFWYTGLKAEVYTGGYVSLAEYATGSLSRLIWVLNFYGLSVGTIILLLHIVLRDRQVTPLVRRLAWLLLIAQIAAMTVHMGVRDLFSAEVRALIAGSIFVLAYAYTAFQQMVSERHLQRGTLQIRLTALISVVTIPIPVALMAFVNIRAGALIEQLDPESLRAWQQFQQLVWTALAVGTAMLLALAWASIRQALRPIGSLTDAVTAIGRGDLTRTAPVESEDEIGSLALVFNSMTGQLRGLIGSLEQRVAERTTDLERRSRYLEASAEVGRAAASILETSRLIEQITDLIRERFDLYYVGLFLVDSSSEWAVLQAGTGGAGRAMRARGHRLSVGEGSMVGWCIAYAQARVALEAGADAVRLATPELPNTRSEAALPLRSRGRVLGALTVQSARPGAFDRDTLTVLQVMADQVAVAIDNARLFAESQVALEAARRATGELSRQAWTEAMRATPDLGYRSDGYSVAPAGGVWRPEMEQAVQQDRAVQIDGAENGQVPLAVPVRVRGNVIGVLDTFKPSAAGSWTPEEIALLEALADQLGIALEGARLYEDSQRRATHGRLVGEITSRMRESLDMQIVLETALDEIHQALDLDEVTIHLAAQEAETSPSANGRK